MTLGCAYAYEIVFAFEITVIHDDAVAATPGYDLHILWSDLAAFQLTLDVAF